MRTWVLTTHYLACFSHSHVFLGLFLSLELLCGIIDDKQTMHKNDKLPSTQRFTTTTSERATARKDSRFGRDSVINNNQAAIKSRHLISFILSLSLSLSLSIYLSLSLSLSLSISFSHSHSLPFCCYC
jgi:hypothetical protein